MPISRSMFIALSRNKALRQFMENSSLGVRMSSRFVAGKTVEEVLAAAAAVNRQGISTTLDSLGENVHSPQEARQSADVYHRLLDAIQQRQLDANVSVKLTQMGMDLDPELAFSRPRAWWSTQRQPAPSSASTWKVPTTPRPLLTW